MKALLVVALALAGLAACTETDAQPLVDGAQPTVGPGYVVVDEFPHDEAAYTQGLDFQGARLFEGTGLNGRSSLRRVELDTGKILRKVDLAQKFFGEGITVLGKRIYQITWQNERAFVYDKASFRRIRRFTYEGEGWGLTHDGSRLIMSNGSSTIAFRDPKTFEVLDEIEVTDGGEPVSMLNELEWVEGEIFANVWQTDDVVRIDPDTGDVVGRLDLTALKQQQQNGEVTNGIAYMESQDRLFVTGKLWDTIYEIELTELP